MIVHIISDDRFFALGCEWILNTNSAYESNMIAIDTATKEYFRHIINPEDIVLIATNSFFETKKLLINLSCLSIKTLVFEDCIIKKVKGSIQKKTFPETLLQNIERICTKNKCNRTILTKREVEVMRKTIQGLSVKSISSSLKIALKTVYIHKRNAYFKIGIRK